MAKVRRWREKDPPHRKAPRPMTGKEFRAWKISSEGLAEKKRLIAQSELRSMPAWLTFRSIWVTKSPAQIDAMTKQHQTKKGVKINECQDTAQSKAWMKDGSYVRLKEWPDTKAGHNKAKKYAEELRAGEKEKGDDYMVADQDRSVRVARVYCKDIEEPGWRWTVWAGTPTGKTWKVFGTPDAGAYYNYRSGLRPEGAKGYHTGQSRKIIEAVACPKCEAPQGESCRTKTYPEGSKTNPHAARRKEYDEIEGSE
jgi:hypothetical protein